MSENSNESQQDADFDTTQTAVVADRSAVSITTLVYALQALSFVFGVTFIAAVVINYVKSADVENTWLESHFKWQVRTFWFAVLWSVIGMLTWFILIGMLIVSANAVWVVYRIVRGWLNLADSKPMYAN